MNCKPDDLAVVVACAGERYRFTLDKIVTVRTLTYNLSGNPCWVLDQPIKAPFCFCNRCHARMIPDAYLRPIAGGDLDDVEDTERARDVETA